METGKNFKNSLLIYIKKFLLWFGLSITVGILCGLLGGLFAKSISLVTTVRMQNEKLILLLPVLSLASVWVYKLCGVSGVGTNQVFEAAQTEKAVPLLLAPAVFLGSLVTHLCGGSAGKEGAALQLGGSASALVSKIFRLDTSRRRILTICGMAGLFSAVFGTSVGAAIFAVEVLHIGRGYLWALLPALASSLSAKAVASIMKVAPEHFTIVSVPDFSFSIILKIALIAVIGALVSILFCYTLHFSKKLFEKLLKNPFLRIFVGSLIIVALTLILNTTDYNGSGIHIIEKVFSEGDVRPEAFLLKIIFTAITVGAGLKGGEIVPTMFIGATLGGSLAAILGLDISFGASLGLATLFCGVTSCPFAALFLCAELFNTTKLLPIAIVVFIGYFLSGKITLYSQKN